MEYVYAALILNEADAEITEDNVTEVLEAAGVDVEQSRVKALTAALEDVDIAEAVESAAAAPAAGGAASAADAEEAEAADEEDDEEEDDEADVAEEEEDDDDDDAAGEGLGELFG